MWFGAVSRSRSDAGSSFLAHSAYTSNPAPGKAQRPKSESTWSGPGTTTVSPGRWLLGRPGLRIKASNKRVGARLQLDTGAYTARVKPIETFGAERGVHVTAKALMERQLSANVVSK